MTSGVGVKDASSARASMPRLKQGHVTCDAVFVVRHYLLPKLASAARGSGFFG